MALITQQELEDAKVDAQTLEDFINEDANFGTGGTFTSRLGTSLQTLKRIITDLYNTSVTIIASTAEAQDLPEVIVTQNTFVDDALGISSFNGATLTYNGANERVDITSANSAKGATLDYVLTGGKKYILYADIRAINGYFINIYSQWATLLATLDTGKYFIEFLADATPGGFGNKVVFTVVDPGVELRINEFRLYEANDLSIYESKKDIHQRIVNVLPLYFGYDFTILNTDLTDITVFGGGTRAIVNSGLEFTAANSGNVLVFDYGIGIDANALNYVKVSFECEITDTELLVQLVWNSGGITLTTSGSGKYSVVLSRLNTQGNASLQGLCFSTIQAGGGKIRLLNITAEIFDYEFDALNNVIMGKDSESSTGTEINKGVVIGYNAKASTISPTVIGENANGQWESVYGSEGIYGAASNNELVAVGNYSKGYGWRTTAVGAKSHAGGQSSTAVGAGAVALQSHALALGRGAYVPDGAILDGVGTVIANTELYFENGWGHKFNLPASGISIGDVTPNAVTVKIHGQDAFDARYDPWSSIQAYTAGSGISKNADVVQLTNKAYKCIQDHTNIQPGITSGWESYWKVLQTLASEGGPSNYNIAGGHIRICVGRSTGTGVGGTAGFQICDGVNLGQNTKQALVDAFFVDSNYGSANTPLCYRRSDGVIRRINEEGDGTLKGIAY